MEADLAVLHILDQTPHYSLLLVGIAMIHQRAAERAYDLSYEVCTLVS